MNINDVFENKGLNPNLVNWSFNKKEVVKEAWGEGKKVGGPRGVIVKAMDCGIVIREFVLQSCYYVHFRANTLAKGMNPLILPAMG